MISVTPVILCGGSGSRLWPLSRVGFPKQFLCLTGEESMFQKAAHRLTKLGSDDIEVEELIIVTGEEHRFLADEQLRESCINYRAALLEPMGRNTAPALTLAALAAVEDGSDPILVVTPADHSIVREEAFILAMRAAIREASNGGIVLLGSCPEYPATGYGYIKATSSSNESDDKVRPMTVDRFIEKPDAETAKAYFSERGYYWNAGMFVLRASVWLNALRMHRPDIESATSAAWVDRSHDGRFIRPNKEMFKNIPSDSIDYAVIEKLSVKAASSSIVDLKMVPLDVGWNDLGDWNSVWNVAPKDSDGNVCMGDVIAIDSQNTLVHATNRLVSLVGVQDLIIVETPDAVLVVDKSRSQDLKSVIGKLEAGQRGERLLHRKVQRPWGWYDSIDEGHRFKVKRIQVNPKASLSLQKHYHRAEHWVVVTGTAEITVGNQILTLTENQSTYIPLGETHRLKNPGNIPLEIIEVQSGTYLGEDDIVRFEDNYGRSK